MKKLLILLFLPISLSLYGTTYYISPNGNDLSSGNISHPFATLNKVWAVVSAGDLVYLRGGTYAFNTQQILTGKNGATGNLIKVWAYPGETPVLSRSTLFNYKYYCGIFLKGNYCHFKGFEITGYRQLTVHVWSGLRAEDSNNNIFELLNIHHNGHGFVIRGNSDKNLVLNCDFHHNQDPLTPVPYDNADGLEIAYIPTGLTNMVKGCRFWWNTDDGIDLWLNEGSVSIENCWSWNNGYIPDTFTSAGNGNGFKFGITVSDYGNTILRTINNCVAYKNRANGFDQNGALCGIELYNNTSYLNGAIGYYFNLPTIVHILKNNIAYQDYGTSSISEASTMEHNTFLYHSDNNPIYSVSDADFIGLDGTQLIRARKADGRLPEIDFLRLKPGSDLIDAGVNVGLPFVGSAPDIGALETNPIAPERRIIIYPNPAHDFFNISIEDPTLSPQIIKLIDLSGIVVLEDYLNPGINNVPIPENLKTGLYIVTLISGSLILYAQKLIINK